MNRHVWTLIVGAAALAAQLGFATAAPQDYRFELVGKPVRVKDSVSFAVRLVRLPGGEAVADAIIAAVDFNMSPEGMAGSNPVAALPTIERGVQRFEVKPEMPGRWELLLLGHVKDEPGEIAGRLIVAVPE